MGLAIIVVVILVAFLILPFFIARGQRLQDASSVNSIEKLEAIKQSLLKRYLEDEEAHRKKLISEGVWQSRKRFLTTRYIDAARRLDYLKHLQTLQSEKGA
ncbi:hypothetical protein [Pseudobacteriovorax antillogorgiicola]|uniref:Uncharacterized protein n=1 Tax=Pseudobacteriovorax antillogorgiicola TaxID=1513793 RepID=A0A1Y6B978_9BACT|nr:hypothetical protein [Pseudobacteriovorax antillogorgiicola]TCS58560.1 hypothetical protein EDD56_10273 [Pseudobacteriovorax antillogorgiicola]SME97616.1 hypothetical protein SAMN06296036_102370 [Pseudobacteriovorax antillogorgiicola]